MRRRKRSVITKHINNIFAEGELDRGSNVHYLHIAQSDKPVAYYNLDLIIAVGYRVRSTRGTQFRQWATRVLHEYLQKGFALNDELLKNGGAFGYWQELLERIRDIRASEKMLYRQVLDLYATSMDYNPQAEEAACAVPCHPERTTRQAQSLLESHGAVNFPWRGAAKRLKIAKPPKPHTAPWEPPHKTTLA